MKKLCIVIFLLILLTSCSSTKYPTNVDANQNSTPKQTRLFKSIEKNSLTPINTQPPNPTITPTIGSEWMEAYAKAIADSSSKPTHITLLDIDFDSVPELFLSY